MKAKENANKRNILGLEIKKNQLSVLVIYFMDKSGGVRETVEEDKKCIDKYCICLRHVISVPPFTIHIIGPHSACLIYSHIFKYIFV
jgi:hypothetical protein